MLRACVFLLTIIFQNETKLKFCQATVVAPRFAKGKPPFLMK